MMCSATDRAWSFWSASKPNTCCRTVQRALSGPRRGLRRLLCGCLVIPCELVTLDTVSDELRGRQPVDHISEQEVTQLRPGAREQHPARPGPPRSLVLDQARGPCVLDRERDFQPLRGARAPAADPAPGGGQLLDLEVVTGGQ